MKCPNCNSFNDKVIETRTIENDTIIRRRRACLDCGYRFTSYERIEERPIMVLKKDGSRQTFSKEKVRSSIVNCTDKRKISDSTIDELVKKIVNNIKEASKLNHEISSSAIGEEILKELYKVDPVSYVRFASVYRSFKNIDEFFLEINRLRN